MITDIQRLCSDKQALGTSAVTGASSTYVLDNVTQKRVYDGRLHFIVKLDNTPAGGTSIQAKVQTSADNSNWVDLADTGTVALATANAKKDGVLLDVTLNDNPGILRYVRVAYTTVGSFSTGPVVTAGEWTEAAPHAVKSF
jgi:hypothetical protein